MARVSGRLTQRRLKLKEVAAARTRLWKDFTEYSERTREVTRKLGLRRRLAVSWRRAKAELDTKTEALSALKRARSDLYVEARYLREAGASLRISE